MMNDKMIRYSEGQWFAVPLRTNGYALGIIVRGSSKTKGGLGYFFGPKYHEIPNDKDTWEKNSVDAVLITEFGDLGIIKGDWPLIKSTRPFSRKDWPVPKFGMEVPFPPGKGFIREYEYDNLGKRTLVKQIAVDANEIKDLPKDSIMFGGFIEITLTNILDE